MGVPPVILARQQNGFNDGPNVTVPESSFNPEPAARGYGARAHSCSKTSLSGQICVDSDSAGDSRRSFSAPDTPAAKTIRKLLHCDDYRWVRSASASHHAK